MANYFKQENYFEEYCDFSIDPRKSFPVSFPVLNFGKVNLESTGEDPCQARNDLFNTVYTVSNAAFCVCTFLFGLLGDRFGSRVTFWMSHYDVI